MQPSENLAETQSALVTPSYLTPHKAREIFQLVVTAPLVAIGLIPLTTSWTLRQGGIKLNSFTISTFILSMSRALPTQVPAAYLKNAQYNVKNFVDENTDPLTTITTMAIVDAGLGGPAALGALRIYNKYQPQKNELWSIKFKRLLSATLAVGQSRFAIATLTAGSYVVIKPFVTELSHRELTSTPALSAQLTGAFFSSLIANIVSQPISVCLFKSLNHEKTTITGAWKVNVGKPWWLILTETLQQDIWQNPKIRQKLYGVGTLYQGFFTSCLITTAAFLLVDFVKQQSLEIFPNDTCSPNLSLFSTRRNDNELPPLEEVEDRILHSYF